MVKNTYIVCYGLVDCVMYVLDNGKFKLIDDGKVIEISKKLANGLLKKA